MQDLDVAQGTLPAGFQFGAYVIGACIGQGGMARIYRSEHRVLRKPVALKVMEPTLLERPDGRPRFLREGQAAAAVKHPNVVDITDVGVWQGRPYLVMELLEGEDLEAYLGRHKPLAEQDVARIMIPVIAGLATAHGAGVIHRDLKPSNVFLARGPDGEVVPKLLDFGISKLANSLRTLDPSSTPIGELMGSPMYMSPEAVRGTRDLTPQADQYSLGVMLYECITGRPPFYGDTLLSVLEAVAHGNFESPRRFRPELSTVLEVAILRAMSREPTDRYPSVRELGRALCEAADQRTRLLWTPSFGLRDVPLGHGTANLQVSALRTGSPLSASVGRRSRRPALWQLGLSAFALLLLAVAVVAYLRMPSYTVSLVAPGAVPGDPVATQQAALAAAPPASASAELPASGAASATPRPPSAAPGGEPARAGTNAGAPAAASRQGEERNGERAGERGAGEQRAGERSEAAAASKAASGATPSSPAASSASVQSRPPAPAKAASAKRPARPAAPAARDTARSAAPPASAVEAAPEPRVAEDDDDDIFLPARAPSPAGPSPVLGANQSPILD